jgi:hypothetical protein
MTMTMARKVDYAAAEREFITAPEPGVSRRELARIYGIGASAMADYARKHDWDDKRQRFLDSVDEEFIRTSALKRARKLADLSERSVDLLEAFMVRTAQQIAGEEGFTPMELSPRDALDVIRQVAVARGDPSDIVREQHDTVHSIDPRLLTALGELAGRALTGRSGAPLALERTDVVVVSGGAAGDHRSTA